MKQASILVVDDERSVTDMLNVDLEEEGYSCVTTGTGEEALKKLSEDNFDLMILDLKLPGISGMDVLKEARAVHPDVSIIIVTAAGDAQTAVDAMKIGARDYITKPFALERVNNSVGSVLKAKTLWEGKSVPQNEIPVPYVEEINWMRYLDAIEDGTRARLDTITGHIMTITIIKETIARAQELHIPEDQIKMWADGRCVNIKRINMLDSLLYKAGQSPATRSAREKSGLRE